MKIGTLARVKRKTYLAKNLTHKWDGLLVEVIQERGEFDNVKVMPLEDRPDDYGRHPFYWSEEDLEVVSA